jgi:hypothetical protein
MYSHKSYMDTEQQEHDGLQQVIDDAPVSVDVFRRGNQAGVAGLTVETAEQEYLRTITVRFGVYRSRSRSGLATAARVRDTHVALTDHTDARADDLWRWTDVADRTRWYRVASLTGTRTTRSVVLEEVKR